MKAYTDLIASGFGSGLYSRTEANQMRTLLSAMDLRKDQSAVLRRETQLVLAYDPAQETSDSLLSELQVLDSDVKADDAKIAAILNSLGVSGDDSNQ